MKKSVYLIRKTCQKNYLEYNEKTSIKVLGYFAFRNRDGTYTKGGYILVPVFSSKEHGPQA